MRWTARRSRRLWWRVLLAVWLVVMLLLVLYLLTRRGCTKRTFPYRDQLEASAAAVAEVLERLDVRYFLCYGSLWGQLHEHRNPPWEADAELCLLKEDANDNSAEDKLVSELTAAGFTSDLDGRRGRYDVYPADGAPGLVQLVLFAAHSATKTYRRDGWMHRAMDDDCELESELHCFPARLVAPPLQRRPFGVHQLPVPWQGFELQKHLYKYSWFRDYEPVC